MPYPLLVLATAACATATGPRQPLLTPIPGVTTAARLLAVSDCRRGLTGAGLSMTAIEDAADEGIASDDGESRAAIALKALNTAAQQGGRDVLVACARMLDNAARARAIRAGTPPAK